MKAKIDGIYHIKNKGAYYELMLKAHNESYWWYGGLSSFEDGIWEKEGLEKGDKCIYFVTIGLKKRMVMGLVSDAELELGALMEVRHDV